MATKKIESQATTNGISASGISANTKTSNTKTKASKATSAKAKTSNTTSAEKPKVEKPKADYKALAESVEKAFKADKTVDVVADTKLENPKSNIEDEYKYIHFYNPGTEKNMFGCYIQTATTTKFAVSTKVQEYLDKSLTVKPVVKKVKGVERTAYLVVECKNEDIVETAKKIIPAYQQLVLAKTAAKEAKKAEKTTAKKSTDKKAAGDK